MNNCCEKCHDVYFDKTYPAHTAYDVCSSPSCPCHSKDPELERVLKMLKERLEENHYKWCIAHDEGQYCHLDDEPDNKENIIPILKSFLTQVYTQAKEEERKAWLAGERCTTCGNEIEASPTNDTCDECWKNN